MTRITEREWLEDFQDFVQTESAPVPPELSAALCARVRAELQPSSWLVFAKLLGIHSVVGTLSLGVCNQFGINPFRTGFSLSEYFMHFGHSTCMFLCGVLFLSLSLYFSRLLLRPEEFGVVRRRAPLQIFGLSMVSLGLFAALGAQLALSIALLWLVGALLGGLAVVWVPGRAASASL